MPVQINEVIVRAIITGEDSDQKASASTDAPETISTVTKNELLDLIDEVINDKKER